MTRTLEDLLTEAGLSTTYKHSSGTLVIPLAQYARFAALVRADALEQAAQRCDRQHSEWLAVARSNHGDDGASVCRAAMAEELAAAIRTLKEQQ
jgi:hypothetical protein